MMRTRYTLALAVLLGFTAVFFAAPAQAAKAPVNAKFTWSAAAEVKVGETLALTAKSPKACGNRYLSIETRNAAGEWIQAMNLPTQSLRSVTYGTTPFIAGTVTYRATMTKTKACKARTTVATFVVNAA